MLHELPRPGDDLASGAFEDYHVISGNGVESFFLRLLQNNDRQPISLYHDPRWQPVINDWGEAHRQHDVCEFFSQLMTKSSVDYLQAHGRRTRLPWRGFIIFWMRGCALSLSFFTCHSKPGRLRRSGIQRLVDEWHRCVDRIQGLDVAPPTIILQLHRFARQWSRITKKSHSGDT